MKWIAYCEKCNKRLKVANNGDMIEAYAEIHIEETGHTVIIGYDLVEENTKEILAVIAKQQATAPPEALYPVKVANMNAAIEITFWAMLLLSTYIWGYLRGMKDKQ